MATNGHSPVHNRKVHKHYDFLMWIITRHISIQKFVCASGGEKIGLYAFKLLSF